MNFALLKDSSLLVAAVFYGVLFAIAFSAGLLGLWLLVVLLPSFWRYAYGVLRATAQGRLNIPGPEFSSLNPVGNWRVVAHCVAFLATVFLLLGVRPFGAQGFGLALNWALAAAILVVLPASTALFGLTGSLEAAFDPRGLAHMIRVLGRAYAGLVVACLALALAAELLPVVLPLGIFSGLAAYIAVVWAVLGGFALTGALLREHRDEFDIPGEIGSDAERRAREQQAEWRKTLDLAYASIRSGLVAEGYLTLRRLSEQHADSAEIRYWLFENMLDWEDRTHALEIARRIVETHVGAGEMYPALELVARCRRIDPRFALEPGTVESLVSFARSIGRHGLADELAALPSA